jgi:excisionase family DNA binding protein
MLEIGRMQIQETQALTIGIEEAARLLGIGRATAYEAARKGQIPTIRIGRRLLVPRARLLRLLDEERAA